MINVGIVGLGYVGLTLSIALSDIGINVYGVETNDRILESISNNKAHFFEPGLDDLIRKYNNISLFCSRRFPSSVKYDYFIITVGTPLQKGEKVPNFDYIISAIKSIEHVYDGTQMVILRSTVSVGTTRGTVLPYLSKLSEIDEERLFVGMCPERTIEGRAVEELKTLPQIVSGNTDEAVEKAEDLFKLLTNHIVKADSLEEAELIKLYNNTYRDMTFSIGNAFCLAAQSFGVDGMEVIRHANEGYSRSKIKYPGFVAGPCLEKDAYLLTNNMIDCYSKDYILLNRKINESLEDYVVKWVENTVKKYSLEKSAVISGMAFKGIPETSDLRGSSSLNIAKKLFDLGYSIYLHDYVAKCEEMNAIGIGEVFENLIDACKWSQLLLILNNYKGYGELSAQDLGRKDIVILDAWGCCSNLRKEYRIIYTLGSINLCEEDVTCQE